MTKNTLLGETFSFKWPNSIKRPALFKVPRTAAFNRGWTEELSFCHFPPPILDLTQIKLIFHLNTLVFQTNRKQPYSQFPSPCNGKGYGTVFVCITNIQRKQPAKAEANELSPKKKSIREDRRGGEGVASQVLMMKSARELQLEFRFHYHII